MKTYRFYIGAPYDTGRISPAYLDEIRAWGKASLGTFTLFQGQGYWQAASENMVLVEWINEAETLPPKIGEALYRLKLVLGQASILVTETDTRQLVL